MAIRSQEARFHRVRLSDVRQEEGREVLDFDPWDLPPGTPPPPKVAARNIADANRRRLIRQARASEPRAVQRALQRMERGFCETLYADNRALFDEHGGNTRGYVEALTEASAQIERMRGLGPVRYGPSVVCPCGWRCLAGHPTAPYAPHDAPTDLVRYL